jgi:hypothetical protein
MNERRRYFIPSQITGGWQLYGLSARHLLRLLVLPVILAAGVLVTLGLWRVVPSPGKIRLILRALYAFVPVALGGLWVGVAVIPVDDAGRTWLDIRRLSADHSNQQTVFLPRRVKPPQ